MLEPEIYLIKCKFSNSRANIEQFLIDRVKDNKKIQDDIKNPLIKNNLENLNEEESKKFKESEEYLENIESGTVSTEDIRTVTTEIAKACFKNNIHDFDIFDNEKQLEENYEAFKNITNIDNASVLISQIVNIFFRGITLIGANADNFNRFENISTQRFYSMLLEWRASGKSYNEMINNFVWYWDNQKQDSYIYVGTKWGEIPSPYYDKGQRLLYIDLSQKTDSQKINIAIIRIKEEQDFIDFKLMPYIEIFNDLGLIEQKYYDKIKYGTDDQEMIKMLKEGFSFELAKAVKSKYYDEYVSFSNNSIMVNKDIIGRMKTNNENEILIFEVEYYIN